jgi:hypothetical protein
MESSPQSRPQNIKNIESSEPSLEQKRQDAEQESHEKINQLLSKLEEPTQVNFGGRLYPVSGKDEKNIAEHQAAVTVIENFKKDLNLTISDEQKRFYMETYAARRLALEKARLDVLYAKYDLNVLNPKIAQELQDEETGTPTDLDKKYTVH